MSPVHLDYWSSLCYIIFEYFKVLNRQRNDCQMLKPGPGGRWHMRWQLLSVTFQSPSSASAQVPHWKLLQRAMKVFENWNLPVWKCETKVQEQLLSTAGSDYELSKSRSVRHINAVSKGLLGGHTSCRCCHLKFLNVTYFCFHFSSMCPTSLPIPGQGYLGFCNHMKFLLLLKMSCITWLPELKGNTAVLYHCLINRNAMMSSPF